MSCKIPINDLSEVDIDNFEKCLIIEENSRQIKKKIQKCPWIIVPKYNTVRRDEKHIYIPFQWGINYFDKKYRTPRESCQNIKIKFKGKLRDEQNIVLKEAVQYLNKNASCLMGVYPGFGKCLGKGTKILLYNGLYKSVEQINIGDELIDENNMKTLVTSITKGQELMYRVYHQNIPSIYFDCNESHILTLWDIQSHKLIDISIIDYIHLLDKSKYMGIYTDHHSLHFNLEKNRNDILNLSVKMEKDKYSMIYTEENLRKIMLCGLNILKKTNYIYFSDPFQVLDNKMKRVMIMFPIKIESLKKDDYYGFELSHNPRFLLWNGIITHNTVVSLAISSMIGLRTLILVNKIMLIDQWIETIKKVFGDYTRIQCIKSQSKIEQGCQFYIMNAINVPKRNSEFYQDLKIGFVIVDECHLILTKIFSRALSYICPRYLLGLSATPFRPDGFDSLFELYFGLKKVVKKLYKAHTVYLVETNIKIVAEKDKRGETIWNSVIDEQTTNDERNKLIIKICLENKNRNILVLSKRICQIEWLYENLKDLDHIAILKDGETQFNRDARILIATFQKVGTGFSHDKLDMLVLATDAEEYFIQYLGRVFRRPDVEPIIFDIVDDNPILKRHFLTRKKVYQEAGGKIVIYK
jgi:superfamily II DNA or RNA helicase